LDLWQDRLDKADVIIGGDSTQATRHSLYNLFSQLLQNVLWGRMGPFLKYWSKGFNGGEKLR